MTPFKRGTALSHTDKSAKIVPRSSTGTSFDVTDLKAGATVGPKIKNITTQTTPKYNVPT